MRSVAMEGTVDVVTEVVGRIQKQPEVSLHLLPRKYSDRTSVVVACQFFAPKMFLKICPPKGRNSCKHGTGPFRLDQAEKSGTRSMALPRFQTPPTIAWGGLFNPCRSALPLSGFLRPARV